MDHPRICQRGAIDPSLVSVIRQIMFRIRRGLTIGAALVARVASLARTMHSVVGGGP